MTRPLITVLTVVLTAAACAKPPAAPEGTGPAKVEVALPPVKVETAAVTNQKMPQYLTLTGSVVADRQSEIAANVSGRVASTYVERGMPVKMGQVIAIVDSKAANFQQAAAVAQSQVAQTQVTLAKQDCERADTLFAQGALPKSEYDRMKTQCTAQLYSATAAQANADLAGKLAGDTIIRAPMDGIIGERYINVGEYVAPSSRVASIYVVNPVRVTISVPEQAVALVKPGQTLNVEVSAYPGRSFPASVRFVSPSLRAATRDLIVEAVAKNDESLLRPGMFATVRLAIGEEEVPTVPISAIKTESTVHRMFLARKGTAFELVVRTGVEKNGRIAVLDTFQPDDLVIVNPPAGLHDGAAIQ